MTFNIAWWKCAKCLKHNYDQACWKCGGKVALSQMQTMAAGSDR